MNLEEKTKCKNYIYKGKILSLRSDDATLPNGNLCKREIVEHLGGACVLPITSNGEVVLVRQFRYAYGEILLEIPAGKLNLGEKPSLTATRELEEETGIIAKTIKYMGEIYPTPGYSNEVIHLFFAQDLSFGKTNFDEDEFLEIIKLPISEVKKLIDKNEIKDAKTIIAVLKYLTEQL